MTDPTIGKSKPFRLRLGGSEVVTVGLDHAFWKDIYHHAMTASWPLFFAGITAAFLITNVVFAGLYALGDHPIANAPPGLSPYLFYFSVETLATVGYGDMHPQTHYGHLVSSVEMFLGLIYAAVVTGLIFARFSRPRPRLVFADVLTVSQHEGRLTLGVRVANARHNTISNATAKLWMVRTERTLEGREFRRFHELPLARRENPLFVLTWSIFHVLDGDSPLHGLDPEALEAADVAFVLSVQGRDENFVQEVQDRRSYSWRDLRWNQRYAEIIDRQKNGGVVINYALFHSVEPE